LDVHSVPHPTLWTTFFYDSVGNRTAYDISIGCNTTAYDAKNRVTKTVAASGERVSYSYDAVDRRKAMLTPGGRVTYLRDLKGRQTAVVNPQGKRTSFAYDAVDRQTRQIQANGSATTQVYDAAGQLTGVKTSRADGLVLNRLTYSYDPTGRRVGSVAIGGRTTWTFDPTYQLLRELASGPSIVAVTWSYDPAGNRTLQIDAGQRTTYSYDAANQLNRTTNGAARTTFAYDNCGNRTQKIAPSLATYYSWDEDNRLSMAEPASGPVTMAYDAENRRVLKQSSSSTSAYLYDFEKVVRESDRNADPVRDFTSTDDQYGSLLSEFEAGGGETLYHDYDALSIPRVRVGVARGGTDGSGVGGPARCSADGFGECEPRGDQLQLCGAGRLCCGSGTRPLPAARPLLRPGCREVRERRPNRLPRRPEPLPLLHQRSD
jgi:YD repeat-containing protein